MRMEIVIMITKTTPVMDNSTTNTVSSSRVVLYQENMEAMEDQALTLPKSSNPKHNEIAFVGKLRKKTHIHLNDRPLSPPQQPPLPKKCLSQFQVPTAVAPPITDTKKQEYKLLRMINVVVLAGGEAAVKDKTLVA
ncbi:hypothetical protein NC651_000357 [Populus alba x Populus x berolinensis]|nr:hypothetical protein NC651_000357 [Populus alba x Populus x berolinensis]